MRQNKDPRPRRQGTRPLLPRPPSCHRLLHEGPVSATQHRDTRHACRAGRRPGPAGQADRGRRAGLLLPGPADGHRDDAADRQPPVPYRPAAVRPPLPGQPGRAAGRRRHCLRPGRRRHHGRRQRSPAFPPPASWSSVASVTDKPHVPNGLGDAVGVCLSLLAVRAPAGHLEELAELIRRRRVGLLASPACDLRPCPFPSAREQHL